MLIRMRQSQRSRSEVKGNPTWYRGLTNLRILNMQIISKCRVLKHHGYQKDWEVLRSTRRRRDPKILKMGLNACEFAGYDMATLTSIFDLEVASRMCLSCSRGINVVSFAWLTILS